MYYWIALFALVGAGKTAVWLSDRIPRFFLGDSAYYIWCAISGAIPSDRSFTYGKVIALISGLQGDLNALMIGQIVFSIFGTMLLGVLLRSELKVSRILAAGATLLMTFEPLHLAYERFVMTETIATSLFALFTFLGICYLNRPNWRLLAAGATVGTVLISFRLNMMLLTWMTAFLLPVLAMLDKSFFTGKRPSAETIRYALKHLALALVFTACAHAIYMAGFAMLRGGRMAYNYAEGLFALASFAPIIQKEDFSDSVLAEKVFEQVTHPLTELNLREAQRWAEGGLVKSLIRNAGGEGKANRIAKAVVMNAAIRDPLGAIDVGIRTIFLYFDKARLKAGLNYDLGAKQFPIPDLKGFPLYVGSLGAEVVGPSPVRWWHVNAWPWYMFLMLCPVWAMVLFFMAPSVLRAHSLLVFALASGLILTGPFLATMAVVRYLHPLSWMTFLTITLLLHTATSRLKQRGRRLVAQEVND
jgi:hypothetical protein